MTEDQSIEAMGHDLDRMVRTSVMMLGQMMERRARRAAEADRTASAHARQGWLDARDSARKTFMPLTFGKRAEQASPRELAAAWRASHEWASTDPVAAAAAEHLHEQWERLHPDKDPTLVGVQLTPEGARRLAHEHAPEFYQGHRADPDAALDARLVTDWEHWSEYGRLPRESLLREHAAALPDGQAAVDQAGRAAGQEWLASNGELEQGGADGVGVRVVPTARANEYLAVRRAAELEAAEQVWQEAGHAPLPMDGPAAREKGRQGRSGGAITFEEARRLAEQHAPEFYTRHESDRLYRNEFRNEADHYVLSSDAARELRRDWEHWSEYGRLPRQSLLSENLRHTGQTDKVKAAVADAENDWLRRKFPQEAGAKPAHLQLRAVPVSANRREQLSEVWQQYPSVNVPEYAGPTENAVLVPADRQEELVRARRLAAAAATEQVWQEAGHDPLPPDPGEKMTAEQARLLAEQHAPAYYSSDRLSDEQLVADWEHWQNNGQQLPREAILRQWAAQLGREDEVYEVGDKAHEQLLEQEPDASGERIEEVVGDAQQEKLEELWASSSQIDVEQAERLAEQHAPVWYSATDSATLRDDWQEWMTTGQLPADRQQEAWAAWAGHGQDVAVEAWTDPDQGVDTEGRSEALQRIWDDGRDERASLEYAAAVAGADAAAADLTEDRSRDAAAWSRVADTLAQEGPAAEELVGDAEHARSLYGPLLDPQAFAQAGQAETSRAWLAATVWASEDPSAEAAAEQLAQQYRVRFGADPGTAVLGQEQHAPGADVPEQAAPSRDVEPTRPAVTPTSPAPDPQRARIVELHEQAVAFYADRYPGSKAEDHMSRRFGPDGVSRSGLTVGYAPAGWDNLVRHLRDRGATDQEMIDAGLARRNSIGRTNDVFRDRAVVAVRDHEDGKPVGFTGRDLSGDERAPKYINTPATAAFDKSRLLVGLSEAPADARLVRVEGAFDVAAINIAGDGKVAGAAPMGTALTAQQAEELAVRSHNGEVLESLDPDIAGSQARSRDVAQFAAHGVSLRHLGGFLDGDPAEAWQRDPALVKAIVAEASRDGTGGHPVSVQLAMSDRISARPDLRGHDNAWPLAEELAPLVAASPRRDQAEAARYAERLIDAHAGVDPDLKERLSPATIRQHLNTALDEVHEREWAPGTNRKTLTADLTGAAVADAEAAAWEAQQDAARAREQERYANEQLEQGRQHYAAAALSDDPHKAEQERREGKAHEVDGQTHQGRADALHSREEELRQEAVAVTRAPSPDVYDRAAESAPTEQVTPGAMQARQRAAAGFSQSTASGVAAAQMRRARVPRKPVKAARMGQQAARTRGTDLGR